MALNFETIGWVVSIDLSSTTTWLRSLFTALLTFFLVVMCLRDWVYFFISAERGLDGFISIYLSAVPLIELKLLNCQGATADEFKCGLADFKLSTVLSMVGIVLILLSDRNN